LSPEQLLGSADAGDTVVIADLEAGLGTFTRLRDTRLDAILVIVEPTAKAIEVGVRAVRLAREKDLGPIRVIANRVRDEADVERVRAAFDDDIELTPVPFDDAVLAADRAARSPVDAAPDSPAVAVLRELAAELPPH
jgi:CO dehydrogenase maturation factor